MAVQVAGNWERSIRRAQTSGLKATKLRDGSFRVPSVSSPGAVHNVTVDQRGHIDHCDCIGWTRYGRVNPCKHAGAVAVAIAFFGSFELKPAGEPAPIETTSGRSRALRMQEAAA